MVHGTTAVAKIAVVAAANLDEERRQLYTDLSLSTFDAITAKAILEDLMTTGNPVYYSAFAQQTFHEGEIKGKAEGKAEGIVAVLDARRIELTYDGRRTILACTDVEQLDRWLARVVRVSSECELLADDGHVG